MGLIKRAMPEEEDKLDPNEQPEGTPVDTKEDVSEGEPLDSGDAQGGGPEYDKFLAAAKVTLFQKGGLAETIGKELIDADDPVAVLADQTYNLVAALDERSGGMLPDELLAPAAADVLGMIVEIAKHAGVKLSKEDVGAAMTTMIKRYMSESGQEGPQAGPQGTPPAGGPPAAQPPMGA